MKNKSKTNLIIVLAFVFLFYLYLVLPSVISWGPIGNYRNFSVRTIVNITEAAPEILNITCNSGTNITLNAGTYKTVVCLVEIRDYNGGITIANNGSVNATFHYYLNLSSQPNNNNTHYTNTSCSVNATSGFNINYSCGFNVQYHANNGTWVINVTIVDGHTPDVINYTVNGVKNATINQLFAINVSDTIDFGSMYVGETTVNAVEANVTNFGNTNLNLTLYGYGSQIATFTTIAMACDVRNISIGNERYSTNRSTSWAAMTPISGTSAGLANFTLDKQVNETVPVVNGTYWRLYVDPADNPFGNCNGTVIYSAVAR